MGNTAQTNETPLSHDLPCVSCGHGVHTFLPCSDTCDCVRTGMPGAVLVAA